MLGEGLVQTPPRWLVGTAILLLAINLRTCGGRDRLSPSEEANP
jgi:hypothetical protein